MNIDLKLLRPPLLIFFLAIFSYSSAYGSGLPAISSTAGNQLAGRFVWFDLLTTDLEQASDYYRRLFEWEINEADEYPGYMLISNQGHLIGGISLLEGDELPAWFGLISVDNVPEALAKVRQNGGTVLESAQDVDGRGTMAMAKDNVGAVLVLIDTDSRDPTTRPIRIGDWIWTDLFTDDVEQSGEFYEELTGLKLQKVKDKEGDEFALLMDGNKAWSGVVEIPFRYVTPIWLPYVRVNDIETTIERSSQLGGKLFFKFSDGAILLDPTGAAIGVQEVSR